MRWVARFQDCPLFRLSNNVVGESEEKASPARIHRTIGYIMINTLKTKKDRNDCILIFFTTFVSEK